MGIVPNVKMNPLLADKPLAGLGQHFFRNIVKMGLGLWIPLPDQGGHQAGSGAQIEEGKPVIRFERHQVQQGPVEIVKAVNHFAAVAVVFQGAGIKKFFYLHVYPFFFRTGHPTRPWAR